MAENDSVTPLQELLKDSYAEKMKKLVTTPNNPKYFKLLKQKLKQKKKTT